jgi:hypothetical protein
VSARELTHTEVTEVTKDDFKREGEFRSRSVRITLIFPL